MFFLLLTVLVMAETTRFTDFEDADANRRWQMVNDNVMGGRSLGDVTFAESVMTFTGSINTNGGGFSSVRLRLREGELDGVTAVRLRVKSDGRPYRLLLEDDQRLPDGRRPSFRGSFDVAASDEWQQVLVDLADLEATWRGNRVSNAEPFDPNDARVLGITLVDDVDGPFELKVDRIEFLRDSR